jgi:hypothetical protein
MCPFVDIFSGAGPFSKRDSSLFVPLNPIPAHVTELQSLQQRLTSELEQTRRYVLDLSLLPSSSRDTELFDLL